MPPAENKPDNAPKSEAPSAPPNLEQSPEFRDAMMQSPEFQAAVAAQVNSIKADLMASFAEMLPKVPSAGKEELVSMFRDMAGSFSEMAELGRNKKRWTPEQAANMKAGHERMVVLLEAAIDGRTEPEYKLIDTVVFGELFMEPYDRETGENVEVVYYGAPNAGMRPLNSVAQAIYDEYVVSIGGIKHVAGEPPIWVTMGGNMVKKTSQSAAMHGSLKRDPVVRAPTVMQQGTDMVKVKSDPRDPRAKEVNVLGTLAAPARQNQFKDRPTFGR